ncbi:hypothetical protein GW916_10195, partial [bacterium]|nr:hypothetical protein [bacterium]
MKTILIWASLFLMADAYGIDLNEYKNFSCRVSTSNGTEVLSGAYEYEWDADDNPANYRVGFDEKKLK